MAAGVATVKSVDPPLSQLSGLRISGVRRRGKMLIVDFEAGPRPREPLALLVHLMSAGRLQLFDRRASLRDRRSRLLIRLAGGGELRLREFGTRHGAWAKLLHREAVEEDEMVATLGPDAWPPPAPEEFTRLVALPRHLHPMLRDQRVIAGIGRSWADEVLWEAALSPFRKGAELAPDDVERLRGALSVLGRALEHYEDTVGEQVPDRMPMPLRVHRRQGEPCPRCGETLAAVHFAEHVTTYCPGEQTGGRVLKDRRLSRLLK